MLPRGNNPELGIGVKIKEQVCLKYIYGYMQGCCAYQLRSLERP